MANQAQRVILPPALGCYVFIWEPRDPPAGSTGEPKYSITLLWKKDEIEKLKALKDAIIEVATAKFGNKAVDQMKVGKLKYPLRDGDIEKPDDPVFAGMCFVTASSTSQPGIVDRAVQPIFEKDKAFSGCIFRASVSVFAYDNVSKGVGIGLSNLQVVDNTGPRLDGKKNAEQDFADFKDESAAAAAPAGSRADAAGLL